MALPLPVERKVAGAAPAAGSGRLLLPPVLEARLCCLPHGHRQGNLQVRGHQFQSKL